MTSALNARAMAWNPTSPATLELPCATDGSLRVDSFLSHTGVGCNEYEATAIIEILDAHDAFSGDTRLRRTRGRARVKTLSKAYRMALRDCLMRWEENFQEEEVQQAVVDAENIELLKHVFATTHLAEVFLFVRPPETSLEYTEDSFHTPGALTADTVRYLRYHHMGDPTASLDEPMDIVEEMLNSSQPDQFHGGKLYWKLFTTLVKRGSLEEAWALLSRHSLCRRCFAENDTSMDQYDSLQREQDREGFLDLRSVLLTAPLPGGRDDSYDSGLDEEADPSTSNNRHEAILLEGVPTTAYKLWETRELDSQNNDYPITYNPRSAQSTRQTWLQYVRELTSIHRLARRLPQLQSSLAILNGNLQGVQFDSWAEALSAELLYVRPSLLPKDISVRASRLMNEYPMEESGFDAVILGIMQGDAGRVVQVLHAIGGGSGAALPAVITSRLCSMFIDAEILPRQQEFEDLCNELLLSSSFAILSSFSVKQSDIGIRLATRLLLPYATPDADPRIVATLAENLQHHIPRSDAEVRALLALCAKLLNQRSMRVLDGCLSIVLSRFRHYLAEDRPGGAVHWLLVGLELEKSLYSAFDSVGEADGENDAQSKSPISIELCSLCGPRLAMWCSTVAASLLRSIIDQTEVRIIADTAKEIVASLDEDSLGELAKPMLEVQTLSLILTIYEGVMAGDFAKVGKNLVLCLRESLHEENGGEVYSIAPRSMHWDLLRLSKVVLDVDARRYNFPNKHNSIPSFDVIGIQVLMEQLTANLGSRDMKILPQIDSKNEVFVSELRLALGHGLKRAFVAENKSKKEDFDSKTSDDQAIAHVRSMNLAKESLETQERVVARMLEL